MKKTVSNGLNTTVTLEEEVKEQTVPVMLPALEDPGDGGIKVDQYEHVTVGNEVSGKTWYVRRGEYVDVPISVFKNLKEKYPKA